MLDIKFVRENPDIVKQNIKNTEKRMKENTKKNYLKYNTVKEKI